MTDGLGPRLARPDAQIAYAVQGRGPLLFLVGAPAGRSGFAALADALADRFTVVTHDPRGIGASSPTAADPTPALLAADLAALADHVSTRVPPDGAPHSNAGVPTGATAALFFGSSGGAVTLLELAARRPDLIRAAVLHEAPLIGLLGEPPLSARAAAAFALADADPQAAAQEFVDLTGAGQRTGPGEVPAPHAPLPPLPESELAKQRYFLGRMAGPTVFSAPDLTALRGVPLTVAAGALSHGQVARRASAALADALGTPLVDMPGNHLAPTTDAAEFAAALTALLPTPGR